MNNHLQICKVVSDIPSGSVASYGQVAELAGLPGKARLVGHTLSKLPQDTKLPWHRVINSQGKLSFPKDSTAYKKQKQRLEKEGIAFINGKISLKNFRWEP